MHLGLVKMNHTMTPQTRDYLSIIFSLGLLPEPDRKFHET
jgi:hypothetical protein